MKRMFRNILRQESTTSILSEQWSVGIYRLKLADGRLTLFDPKSASNPVLTARTVRDQRSGFVADPFLVLENDRFFMFLEVFKKDKAHIGYAVSKDGVRWKFMKTVLEEPFHLSYPFVMKSDGKFFMVPESYSTQEVRLYEAVRFPEVWRFSKAIITGRDFVDPTIFRSDNKLWMFVSDVSNSTLYLYFADVLEGAWREHPQSPIVKENPSIARPAGNVIQTKTTMIRLAQDCSKTYGESVRAFEITKLTATEYSEKELPESPLCTATGKGWNRDGMHHVSVIPLSDNEWLAAVDGKVVNTEIAAMHVAG